VKYQNLSRQIRAGVDSSEIATKYGVTRQRIEQKINDLNLYKLYKAKREERKKKKKEKILAIKSREGRKVLREIFQFVYERIYKNTNKLSERKTLEYFLFTETRCSLSKLERLFSNYEKAINSEEEPSQIKLSKGTNITYTYIGKILKRVGLKLFLKRNKPISEEEIERIKVSSRETGLSLSDITYFTEIKEYIVRAVCKRQKIKIKSHHNQYFNYKLASQIYEAKDSGYFKEFSKEEVAQLLNTSTKTIDYALENRKLIEKVISQSLKVIYPERKETTPYLTQTERKALKN